MIAAAIRHVRLLFFAWSLSNNIEQSVDVVADVEAATSDEWEQRWLTLWSFLESRWRADAVDPTGTTHGSMQVSEATWGPVPSTRVAQFVDAIEVLHVLELQCGTRKRALQAYSAGPCGTRVRLVEERCVALGGCE